MKNLNVAQGSDLWLETRKQYFCASDAAAMMGDSKYKSRKQLLHEKKTGNAKPIDSFTQGLFDRGHAAEAAAREIIELTICETFAPVVGTKTVKGVKLLASLDGLSDDEKTVFEHKLLNQTLVENVRNDVLEPSHYWQLEHQLLVSGAETVLFVCSDGTEENMECMNYVSVPERRKQLIAGWQQFAKDLEAYEVEAKAEAVVAAEAEDFPLVKYSLEGSMIVSNIADILPIVKDRAEVEMNRVLETDQDFADKENFNKATVKARAMLKDVVANVKGEFVSFSEFADTAAQIDAVLQKMQSQGEKQVKQAKEQKKQDIQSRAGDTLRDYISDCNSKIQPISLRSIQSFTPDFITAMKGKRNLESLQSAVDDVVAKQKIEINAVMSRVVPNQIYLREHAKDYAFLFADTAQIINQETEPFQAVVKSRIADHKESEKKKADDLREEIRIEEERKAQEKIKPAPVEDVKPQAAAPSTVASDGPFKMPVKEVSKPTATKDPFVTEVMEWQKKHNISDLAVDDLVAILAKYEK